MEDVVTLSGYSEGGYASTVGAFALRKLGITIWGHFPGGSPLNPLEQFAFMFGKSRPILADEFRVAVTLPHPFRVACFLLMRQTFSAPTRYLKETL